MPAHGFYPDNPEKLKQMINSFKETGQDIKPVPNSIGCILPHAGYTFSGSIAMHTLMAAQETVKEKQKFIIFGPDHYGFGTSNQPSEQEHSTDVQKPLIHALNEKAEIQEKILGNELGFEDLKEMAKELTDRKAFFIASSDFIHFGPSYGKELPENKIEDQIKWVKNTDNKLASLICKLKAKDFYNLVEHKRYTICGYKAITLVILITKLLGATQAKVIEHNSSYDIMPSNSFVDYMGIVIF